MVVTTQSPQPLDWLCIYHGIPRPTAKTTSLGPSRKSNKVAANLIYEGLIFQKEGAIREKAPLLILQDETLNISCLAPLVG